jgi:glutathione S-transferase
VLVETDEANATQRTLVDSSAIVEFLEETCHEPPLLGGTPEIRAEVRRVASWFDLKFHREVTVNLVDEKINKRFLGLGQPSSAAIRAGYANLETHLAYVSWLMERRNWLAGDAFSLADIAAAAQISCIDYIGDVPWESWPEAKHWYARVKSRPSLRPLLADHIPGAPPPKHYADLDF